MSIWPDNPCNDYRGTDGTIFPPFLTVDKDVWAVFPDICRSIVAYYVEPGMVQGINIHKEMLLVLNKLFLNI